MSMTIPANTLIYAITGFRLFSEPDVTSEPVLFASDAKMRYDTWKTKDTVGLTTGAIVSNSSGTWVEVITRRWKQRVFDKVRVDRNAWFRIEDKKWYTEEGAKVVEQKSLETRLAEAYDSLSTEYRAVETYVNDAGKTILVFKNGNRVDIETYEKLSLVEKRKYALITPDNPSPETPPPSPETPQSLPTWAIALIVGGVVVILGLIVLNIPKKKKNGTRKR